MTATHADQIISGYLKRLEGELAVFPSERRRELTAQITEHISSARAELAAETDAELLTILDRLGEPEEIASEARTRFELPASAPGPIEILALLLIGVGPLVLPLPPVGWIAGVGLVWRSRIWSPNQKRRGAYLPLVVALVLLLVGALVGGVGGGHLLLGFFFLAVLVAGMLLPVGTAFYLGSRLGRRLPMIAWVGIVVVALMVYLPAVATLLPGRTYGFVGAEGPPGSPVPVAGRPGCGGFYGTAEYASGTPLVARIPVSIGFCFDGTRVTKTWGPDCFPASSVGLIARVQSCQAITQPDGSLIVSIQGSATALTAPLVAVGRGVGWRIAPDGALMQFG